MESQKGMSDAGVSRNYTGVSYHNPISRCPRLAGRLFLRRRNAVALRCQMDCRRSVIRLSYTIRFRSSTL